MTPHPPEPEAEWLPSHGDRPVRPAWLRAASYPASAGQPSSDDEEIPDYPPRVPPMTDDEDVLAISHDEDFPARPHSDVIVVRRRDEFEDPAGVGYHHPPHVFGQAPAGMEAAGTGSRPLPRLAGGETRQAMLTYLTVPVLGFVVPLSLYLFALRRSRWLRVHSAQALNVWFTGLLYDLSAAIMGAMLALDSPTLALAVVIPLVVLLWLVTLGYLIRAAAAASQGTQFSFPHWLCAPVVR